MKALGSLLEGTEAPGYEKATTSVIMALYIPDCLISHMINPLLVGQSPDYKGPHGEKL